MKTQRFRVILETRYGLVATPSALLAGSNAAHRALATLGATWLKRLQPLCGRRREELEGLDYLDASVLDYALCKSLEAAYPKTGGDPPKPLTRNAFVLRIVENDVLELHRAQGSALLESRF